MSQKELNSTESLSNFSFLMPLQSSSSSIFKNVGPETQNANKTESSALQLNNNVNISNALTNAAASFVRTKSISLTESVQTPEATNSNSGLNGMSSENLGLILKNKVDEINKKREKDSTVSSEFHACITQWANESTKRIIEAMFKKFQENAIEMSSKLELIQKDLESIEKLENELLLISNQIEQLYRDIKLNS